MAAMGAGALAANPDFDIEPWFVAPRATGRLVLGKDLYGYDLDAWQHNVKWPRGPY